MEALIKPNDYTCNEVLKNENEKIFKKAWHFAGIKKDYDTENKFKTFNIAGIPVVVQNLNGEIKAFKNICSHRHSIIQTASEGVRPLLCPYHGWAYNNKGIPVGIPKKPLFSFSKSELQCLKLMEFEIDYCGELVFVRIENSGINLKNYLGIYFNELSSSSKQFDSLIDINKIKIKANWKILVENTLESYHVNLVHANTFRRLGASGLDFDFDGPHSKWRAELANKETEGKQARINKFFSNRNYKIDGYNHVLIFPNLLYASTYGISFNLSLMEPISYNETSFTSYVFLSNHSGKSNVAIDFYKKSLIKFNRDVFNEDKVVCEGVQIGAKNSHYNGQLSEEESRVCEFQKSYINFMNSN